MDRDLITQVRLAVKKSTLRVIGKALLSSNNQFICLLEPKASISPVANKLKSYLSGFADNVQVEERKVVLTQGYESTLALYVSASFIYTTSSSPTEVRLILDPSGLLNLTTKE